MDTGASSTTGATASSFQGGGADSTDSAFEQEGKLV